MYLIFISSLNENVKLANIIQKQLEEENKQSTIINLVDLHLPMYDSYKEQHDGIPKVIDMIMEQMDKASGYIFVTPEYNYSSPPVLTNFIAWISRNGNDFRKVFALKYIQLATHSGAGGNNVMNAMRTQFTKLGSIVVPREIITTYQSPLKEDSCKRILQQYIQLSQ